MLDHLPENGGHLFEQLRGAADRLIAQRAARSNVDALISGIATTALSGPKPVALELSDVVNDPQQNPPRMHNPDNPLIVKRYADGLHAYTTTPLERRPEGPVCKYDSIHIPLGPRNDDGTYPIQTRRAWYQSGLSLPYETLEQPKTISGLQELRRAHRIVIPPLTTIKQLLEERRQTAMDNMWRRR